MFTTLPERHVPLRTTFPKVPDGNDVSNKINASLLKIKCYLFPYLKLTSSNLHLGRNLDEHLCTCMNCEFLAKASVVALFYLPHRPTIYPYDPDT